MFECVECDFVGFGLSGIHEVRVLIVEIDSSRLLLLL